LTRPWFEPTIYGTRGEHANHYTTNSVHMKISCIFIYLLVISLFILPDDPNRHHYYTKCKCSSYCINNWRESIFGTCNKIEYFKLLSIMQSDLLIRLEKIVVILDSLVGIVMSSTYSFTSDNFKLVQCNNRNWNRRIIKFCCNNFNYYFIKPFQVL
jgi:hypothetical protein